MNRVDKIRKHPVFQSALIQIEKYEKNRIFCKHNMQHFLDVARIATILTLDEQLDINREVVYAAALLHDMGRYLEYEGKCSHESGSILIALKILSDAGFNQKEEEQIVKAIASHRNKNSMVKKSLESVISRADQLSRPCYSCQASEQCNWNESRKNTSVLY